MDLESKRLFVEVRGVLDIAGVLGRKGFFFFFFVSFMLLRSAGIYFEPKPVICGLLLLGQFGFFLVC